MAVVDVELIEGDPAPPPRARERHPWRIAAAVAVVLLLAFAGQAWLDARHRAHLAQFDEVSGVLLPPSGTARARWTVDPRDDGLDRAANVHGHLVSGFVDAGGFTVRELDRATGAARWTTTVDVPAGTVGDVTCVPAGEDDLVVCALGATAPTWTPAEPVRTRLLVVDAATGRQVDDRSASIRTWVAAGGHVVTATSSTRADTVTWTLESHGTDGTAQWRTTLDPVTVQAAPPQDEDSYSPGLPLWLSAARDRVAFTDEGRVWVLDGGTVTDHRTVKAGGSVEVVEPGVLEITEPVNDTNADSWGVDGTLVPLDGDPVQFSGWPVTPFVDDGSAPDTLVVQEPSDGLVGLDARTGERRWAVPVTDVYSGLVLGGTLYVNPSTHTGRDPGGPSIDAIDLRTGRTLWSRTAIATGNLATDGRAVYLVENTRMEAFAIDDGTRLPPVQLVAPPLDAGSDANEWYTASDGVLMRVAYDEEGNELSRIILG